MNWYKKTAAQNETIVYHVSPESDIHTFRPRGKNTGTQAIPMDQPGIYVAPTFFDSLKWWFSFVGGKKRDQQTQNRSERLVGKGKGFHSGPMYYQNLTIYKLSIPKVILDQSWGSNFWEKEFFISKDNLKSINIVGKRTYAAKEALSLLKRMENTKSEQENPKKSFDETAKKVRTSEISNLYLKLKEQYREILLSKRQFSDMTKNKLNKLFQKLEMLIRYFSYGSDIPERHQVYPSGDWGKKVIINNPSQEEIDKAQSIANEIKYILNIKE